MSADTTSSLGGWLSASVLNSMVLVNFFEQPGLKATVTNLGDRSGMGGLTFEQPVWNPGSLAFAAHSEAGSITATSEADDSYNVTVAQQVLDHVVTDEALWAIDGAGWMDYCTQRAEWFAAQADNRISAMICALYDDFTTVEGTAGDVLTVDDLLLARADLQVADGVGGAAFGVVHNVQFSQLLTSIRAESMDGMLNMKAQELGKFGAVKGTFATDIVLIETNLVGTVSSNYRGALYRPSALGYAHGVPRSLNSWSPRAQVRQVTPGEVEAYLASRGIAAPAPRVLNAMAAVASGMASGSAPAIYIETARDGSLSTREVRIGASLFCGVGQQVSKGIGLRSTT